jgi:hypothetical protein
MLLFIVLHASGRVIETYVRVYSRVIETISAFCYTRRNIGPYPPCLARIFSKGVSHSTIAVLSGSSLREEITNLFIIWFCSLAENWWCNSTHFTLACLRISPLTHFSTKHQKPLLNMTFHGISFQYHIPYTINKRVNSCIELYIKVPLDISHPCFTQGLKANSSAVN